MFFKIVCWRMSAKQSIFVTDIDSKYRVESVIGVEDESEFVRNG